MKEGRQWGFSPGVNSQVAEQKKYELVLLQYAPDAIASEFATIGVLLLRANGASATDHAGRQPLAVDHQQADDVLLRFTRDWRRVRCLDPDADVEMLAALEDDIRRQLTRGPLDRATLLTKLQDYCSNGLRFTAPKACLAEDPQREMETLAGMYLERKYAGGRERSARHIIFGRMRDAFEQAGVWGLMLKKIPAADYTHRGDPLKIDCGYKLPTADGSRPTTPSAVDRPPSRLELFHAISLASDVDAAKILAFSFPELRDGIRRKEGLRAELTAITEDGLDLGDPAVAFALATLQRGDIAVAAARDLAPLAERARRELKI